MIKFLKVCVVGLFVIGIIVPAVVIAQETGYKIFHSENLIKKENPNNNKFFREEIVTDKDGAKDVNGIFLIIPPAPPEAKVSYHYHKNRESMIYIISGQGVEFIEGKEVPIKAGDMIFIQPMVKHAMVNNSDGEIRYTEFFTYPPVAADFVKVE
jgi:quercetin dioxygenase-like cupin family protein